MGEGRNAISVQDDACILDIVSGSMVQTQKLGMQLGRLLCAGDLILLDGHLGAGKTTFTQGLAKGMGISDVVNSPTFTLLKEYSRPNTSGPGDTFDPFNGPAYALYHFDLYRLDEPEEIYDLGFEDYFYGSGVSIVEWADKAEGLWPAERLYIHLKMLDETKRSLYFIATGERYCELLRQFQKNTYATIGS